MILAALERQDYKNFEIIISDDGSKPEVVEEIKNIIKTSSLTIKHVWHEDLGFRKTKILNEAIRKSETDYLIFIDGDCIPHCKFVGEHVLNKATKTLLAGRRVNLSEELSLSLSEDKIKNGFLENGFTFKVLVDSVFGRTSHAIKGVYVKNKSLQKFLNRKMTGVLGCNFSIHKIDLLEINGFDERYEAPAIGEDTDIEYRLTGNNVRIQMIKNMAVQYHIYHKKLDRPNVNQTIFDLVKKERAYYTSYGIDLESKPQD
jgi:glycosyltransferase involved in cell wall biosynthesis